MKTRGVTQLQAKTFYTKFWSKHIDSQALPSAPLVIEKSRVVQPQKPTVPFKERIRPGMVVEYKPNWDSPLKQNLAIVLCPEWAVDSKSPEAAETIIKGGSDAEGPKYLCALVTPGIMAGAYTLSMWSQVIIAASEMEEEITLEYDAATRFYYITV